MGEILNFPHVSPGASATSKTQPPWAGQPAPGQPPAESLHRQLQTLVAMLKDSIQRLAALPAGAVAPDNVKGFYSQYSDLEAMAVELARRVGQQDPLAVQQEVNEYQNQVEAFVQAVRQQLPPQEQKRAAVVTTAGLRGTGETSDNQKKWLVLGGFVLGAGALTWVAWRMTREPLDAR